MTDCINPSPGLWSDVFGGIGYGREMNAAFPLAVRAGFLSGGAERGGRREESAIAQRRTGAATKGHETSGLPFSAAGRPSSLSDSILRQEGTVINHSSSGMTNVLRPRLWISGILSRDLH